MMNRPVPLLGPGRDAKSLNPKDWMLDNQGNDMFVRFYDSGSQDSYGLIGVVGLSASANGFSNKLPLKEES